MAGHELLCLIAAVVNGRTYHTRNFKIGPRTVHTALSADL